MDGAHDLGGSARRVAATIVEIARTRIELAGTELAEERLRLAQQALAATLALFCLGVGLVLAVLGLAWWAGPDHGAAVLGVGALVLLAGRRRRDRRGGSASSPSARRCCTKR